ncbi:ABC transporter ATP-binding protein [Pollutimonas bauzanensis]|uniref:ABC transporter ATP-binding protein n=1 Tax=Pollutimonas bauzanensis TaxID=658167 RepID=UPI00333E6001
MSHSVTPPTLLIEDLTVSLPSGSDRPLAINNLSLSIQKGQTLCVVGESGSGKSVTATAVMGLLPKELQVSMGTIELRGEPLLTASKGRLRALQGRVMSMVFQEPMTALNPVMTCGAQLDELLRKHTAWSKNQRRESILQIIARVRLPDPERILQSYPHQLSGGQRQRIVIAMAMILRPELLICDEPTTALDVTTQKEILELIGELKREHGVAILFITHDMGVVAEIADYVLVMHQGTAVEYGPKDQVLQRPSAPYTKMLLAAVPSMTPPPPRPQSEGLPLLHGVQVSKSYESRGWVAGRRQVAALTQATVSVRRGETVGIVGESGSGKSTFARCLVRLIDPTAGEIHWSGDDSSVEVSSLSQRQLRGVRDRVQIIFQDPNRSLNPRQKIGESVIEGALNFGVNRADAEKLARELIQRVKLPVEALDRYPNQFSGGQRQRIAIARALACRPRVLVADEAVSALDVSVQAQIMVLLREIQSEFGLGMLFITHDLRVAAQLCDRVVVMHQGKIMEEGPTAALYSDPSHDYTRKLFAAAPSSIAVTNPILSSIPILEGNPCAS